MNITRYRGIIRSRLYLNASRHDIMFATSFYARFLANPMEFHLVDVKQIFRYLCGTLNFDLWYTKESQFDLTGYYTNYSGCGFDRKRASDTCQFVGNRLI